MKTRRNSLGAYIVLAVVAAGLIGINVKAFGERFHRSALEADGVVVQGRIVDHLLAHCAGFRCSQRTTFSGEIGSESYRDFRSRCGSGRSYRCHTDLLVRYDHVGRPRQLVGQVALEDFERLKEGSTVAVLVDVDDPSNSILRDHEPEGFLFYIALFVDVVVAFVGVLVFGAVRRPRRRSGYARR